MSLEIESVRRLVRDFATSEARSEFVRGLYAVLPLLLAAMPFDILFGTLALTIGLPWWAAWGMSLLVFAGSAQFLALLLLSAGTTYPFIVLSTLILNLRHALYGASIAEYLRNLPEGWRALLAFGMTDESYAIAITHFRERSNGDAAYKHWYMFGANLGLYVPWQIATLVGYFLGHGLGDPMALGLDFALPVIFIALLVPQLKTWAGLASALAAGAAALLTLWLPNRLGLLAAIGVGIIVGLLAEKWTSRS